MRTYGFSTIHTHLHWKTRETYSTSHTNGFRKPFEFMQRSTLIYNNFPMMFQSGEDESKERLDDGVSFCMRWKNHKTHYNLIGKKRLRNMWCRNIHNNSFSNTVLWSWQVEFELRTHPFQREMMEGRLGFGWMCFMFIFTTLQNG